MRRILFLVCVLYFGALAFAQPGVTIPPRYQDDAMMVFMQGFEKADPGIFNQDNGIRLNASENRPTTLYTWDVNPIDRIDQITYYKREGMTNPSGGTNIYNGEKQWEIAGIRDTLINLYDGVVKTDGAWPEDSILAYDQFSIAQHTTETQQGNKGLDAFGENGGLQYFSYSSAEGYGIQNVGSSNYSTSNKSVAAYRRNLFLRNIPIEANSSYRVTVFVKPTQLAKEDLAIPRFGLDLFRGYSHIEKPFLVDGVGSTSTWGGKSYAAFDDKSDYTDLKEGEWNKVVLMAYYINDSIGDASAYLASYYWAGDWDWTVGRDADGAVVNDFGRGKARNAAGQLVNETSPSVVKDTTTLTFIQQPDKFFVRLSFRSDSTQFDVDNISVTKSWIAGVEHHNDLLRVDFGYETNIGALAQAAYEKKKIAAVELPGEYFDVWARFQDEKTGERYWSLVPIRSAEYHADGYMYMWTEPWEDDGSMRSFEGADSVLVSFRNPVDRDDLKLLYTGTRYPNGGDIEWQNNPRKRLVFDFHNELSSLNPNIDYSNGRKVLSLKDMPPVMLRAPYEDGTFGLDPNLREMTFRFSRQLYFENTGTEYTNASFVKVVGNNTTEYWQFMQYANDMDTNTVIVRPSKYTTPLSGDYKITIDQITHLDDAVPTDIDSYGPDVVLNLHFGDFNVNAISQVVTYSNWRADIEDYYASNKRQVPISVYLHTGTDPFQKGDGTQGNNKCGFYNTADDTITVNGIRIPDNGMFYLSNRTSGNTGNLYSIVNLNKGYYSISFKLGGHFTTSIPMQLKFYAKPVGNLEDGNDNGFNTLESVYNKTVLEAGKSPAVNQGGYYYTTTKWKDGIETLTYIFTVPSNGEYVFEWVASGSSNYYGYCISNYWIRTAGDDLSFQYVAKINEALSNATNRLVGANVAKYRGDAFNNLVSIRSDAQDFIATKKATGVNLPSEYEAEVKLVNDGTNALMSRMELIDSFFETLREAQAKIDIYRTADSLAAYRNIPDLDELQALKDSYSSYNYSAASNADINEEKEKINDAIRGIDNRAALAEVYPDAIAYAYAMKNTAITKGNNNTYPDTYAKLIAAIDQAEAYDINTLTYSELRAEMTALTDAAFEAAYKEELVEITPRRIKELDAIARSLNVIYPDSISDRIAAVDFDDENLAEIIKCYIKIALYEKIIRGENVENFDLTPFIKNYYLYATVKDILDNSDLELPSSRNDARVQALQGAAQIQKIGHQWGSDEFDKKIWVLILNQEYTDLLPGWVVESFVTGNHSMVSLDTYNGLATISPDKLANNQMVFDGVLSLEWNSKAELKQLVTGLPAGDYSIGVQLSENAGNGANMTVGTDVDSYVKDLKKTDSELSGIQVLEDNLYVDFVIETTSGKSNVDDFSISYSPIAGFNYSKALASANAELSYLLTGVDPNPPVPDGSSSYGLYTEKVSVEADNNLVVPIKIRNEKPVVGFSLDVELPSEFSFVSAEMAGNNGSHHILSTNKHNGKISLACLSLTNDTIEGGDESVINLTIYAPCELNGEYDIWLSNMELAVSAREYYRPEAVKGTVLITPYIIPGDVNEDGYITIADGVGVVNFILNLDTEGLNHRAADINRDGVIDVADAVAIVNIVINKNYAPMRGDSNNSGASEITSRLSMGGSIVAGGSSDLSMKLNGIPNEITALQFNMSLPDKVSVNGVSTENSHIAVYGKQPDGTYTFVCLSMNSSTLAGNGGAALSLQLSAESEFENGEIAVTGIRLVTPDCRKVDQEPFSQFFESGGVTSVDAINADSESIIYDLQGRVKENSSGIYIQEGKKILKVNK